MNCQMASAERLVRVRMLYGMVGQAGAFLAFTALGRFDLFGLNKDSSETLHSTMSN